jgi:acyl carrier protein
MNTFLPALADCLDRDAVNESDVLADFPEWDSLSVLSVIALIDADYGVNLVANDLKDVGTAGDLWRLVQSRKG